VENVKPRNPKQRKVPRSVLAEEIKSKAKNGCKKIDSVLM
jgi:hypothetical protein